MGDTPDVPKTLRHVRAGSLLADTAQTPGMEKFEAVSGKAVGCERLWMGETHVAPGTQSGDHHHGRSETGIYVVAGNPVFVVADGDGERRIETSPGTTCTCRPSVPHREENPAPDTDAVVVIARSTQEAIVVNVAGLHAEVVRR